MTRQKSVDCERLFRLSLILRFDFYNAAYKPHAIESPQQTSELVEQSVGNSDITISQLTDLLSALPSSSNIAIQMSIYLPDK